jgi:hypothetical protein
MASEIPHLRVAVLYGSAIKGDFHKKSDIDMLLLFDAKHNPEVGEEAKIAHKIGSDALSKHNVPHSFSFVMENMNDQHLDTQFLRTVVNEGIVIWARPEINVLRKPQPNMEPVAIFSYSLTSLTPKEKMAVHRALYGYRVEKVVKRKRYVNETKGIVGEYGEKLGNGVFKMPSRFSEDISELFKKYGVEYKKLDAWL